MHAASWTRLSPFDCRWHYLSLRCPVLSAMEMIQTDVNIWTSEKDDVSIWSVHRILTRIAWRCRWGDKTNIAILKRKRQKYGTLLLYPMRKAHKNGRLTLQDAGLDSQQYPNVLFTQSKWYEGWNVKPIVLRCCPPKYAPCFFLPSRWQICFKSSQSTVQITEPKFTVNRVSRACAWTH